MQSNDYLHDLRHSAAHLLAQAVLELYPGTLPTIGPVTETGFFYDFLPSKNFKEEDLPKIEARMRELVEQDLHITGHQVPKDEARVFYKHNPFKLEIIDQVEGETVGIYSQGTFSDLCRGGHLDSIGQIKHFKLMSISGAYWRADRSGQALQRITGICFPTQEELDAYLKRQEELAMYDHRRLGKQLGYFTFDDHSPGVPFFHSKGTFVFNQLIDFMRKLQGDGYHEIKTPMIMHEQLWKTSKHYDNYKELMYFTKADEQNFCVKPMNCPGSILMYQEKPHSYRELPLRLSEFGHVYRYELSGVLHGMFRVRAFTQDDGHHYCTPDQIEKEVSDLLKLCQKVYTAFGFQSIQMALSTRPEKSIGEQSLWDTATQALKNALESQGYAYKLQEGEGAFYGPKIEVKIKDAMGREWQCGTIQVDFFQPENFKLDYIDADQSRKRPVIVHRAIYGSIERFFGILLEHTKGHLPFWITPTQIRILTISDNQLPYGHEILTALKAAGLRVELDEDGGQISAKIRRAQQDKIPWMLVLGQKEADAKTLTLRYNDGKQLFGQTLEQIIEQAKPLAQLPV